MATKSYIHRRIWPYAVAVLIGVVAGSLPQLRSLYNGAAVVPPSSTVDSRNESARYRRPAPAGIIEQQQGEHAIASGTGHDSDASDNLVIVSDGLVLRPAFDGSGFLGYEVVRSETDLRLLPGEIIEKVNGQPVENSAAGGELLMIGLRNPDAELTFAVRQ